MDETEKLPVPKLSDFDKLKNLRSERGLTRGQEKFLFELSKTLDWKTAAKRAEVAESSVQTWKKRDTVFREAYDQLFRDVAEGARIELTEATDEAAAVLREMLHATKDQSITCPYCDHSFNITISDNPTRKGAAETILKGTGALKDQKRVDINAKSEHTERKVFRLELTLSQRIALARFHAGQDIPSNMRAELASQGLLESGNEAEEGEFTEIEEEQA